MTSADREQRQFAALPYVRDDEANLRVLLISSRGTGRWVLPRGWPKPGESGAEAASREAVEEAGVTGRITTNAIGSYRYDKGLKSGDTLLVKVLVYGLEVEKFSKQFSEKGKRVLRWCAPSEAADFVAEPALSRLLRGFTDAHSPSGC